MDNDQVASENEEWVIWNGSSGLLMLAKIGRIEPSESSKSAWMAPPFEMLGPFNLDELVTHGRINFAACTVMSRQRWQDDQAELRLASYHTRRAAQERLNEKFARFNGGRSRRQTLHKQINDKQFRATLNLPADGKLELTQIKKAFRRLAQKTHPDVGGTHEQFIIITEARNALLESI